ncbi:MAG: Ig domain-containing protein, partial [Steroidobacteraceae bacterium]
MKTFEGFKRLAGALLVAVLGVAALAGPAHAVNRTVNGITIDTDLPTAQRGVPYDFTVAPTGGGGAPYSYEVLAGTPPPGITFNSDGRVFGVSCGLNGPYSLDVRVTSATGTVADFAGNPNGFTIQLTAGPGTGCDLSVSLGGLPATGLVGTPYTGSVTATGGTTPYTFSIASGALPTGLTLDPATGVVSGTPTVAGVFNFVLSATDAAGLVGSQAYTITIGLGVSISPATLPDGTFGVAYGPETLSASGGDGPPYTLSVSAGALPDGLTFDAATGAISGTPTQAGSFDFTISATDVSGNIGSQDYTVVIDPVVLDVAPATLPDGTFGVAYSQTITASGGDGGPYTYSVTAGSLPNGLSLDGATGVISGSPSLVGSFSFTVTAADGSGNSGSQAYTVDIAGVNLTIEPATLSA